MSNRVILTLSTIATLDRIYTGKCMPNLLEVFSCMVYLSCLNVTHLKMIKIVFLHYISIPTFSPSEIVTRTARGFFSKEKAPFPCLASTEGENNSCLWLVSVWSARVVPGLIFPSGFQLCLSPLSPGLSRRGSFNPLFLTDPIISVTLGKVIC